MPVSNPQCANYFIYCIIQMVFNVSSDLLMLAVPIPFVIGAQVSRAKKVLLVGIFSLGVFVILAAVLNKVYNFTEPNVTVYMVWDIRETSTAVYVANLMCCWPLAKKVLGMSKYLRRKGEKIQSNIITIEGVSNTGSVQLGDLKSADFLTSAPGFGGDGKGVDTDADPGVGRSR